VLDALAKTLEEASKSSQSKVSQELQHIRQRHWHLALVAARTAADEPNIRTNKSVKRKLSTCIVVKSTVLTHCHD
jgi:hypothetical protein